MSKIALADLETMAAGVSPPRGFGAALRAPPGRLALIAEIKKASPSKGLIRADFDPPSLAKAYAKGRRRLPVGADRRAELPGRRPFLTQARNAVGLPCLRRSSWSTPGRWPNPARWAPTPSWSSWP